MRVAVWAIAAFSALGGCTAAPELAPGIVLAEIAPPVADDPTLPARFHKPLSVEILEPALFDEAVLVYVNRMRAQAGRPPLRRDVALAQAAQTHAINMAHLRTHSHRLPIDGESRLAQRMSRRA